MALRHVTRLLTWAARLGAVVWLLSALVPLCAEGGVTIPLNGIRTLQSMTLDGSVLDATASAAQVAGVTVVLQRCTIKGGGLIVNNPLTAPSTTFPSLILNMLDTEVQDATIGFLGYLPISSSVRIVNVTAMMQGRTPLFDLQNFYLTSGDSPSSMVIQRVRATWGSGPGGSVILFGAPNGFSVTNSNVFTFSEATVTGAAHVLEVTPLCTYTSCLTGSFQSLIAFDMIDFRDARGAFMYSDVHASTLSSSTYGVIRFSNITVTNGQPFFDARNGDTAIVDNSVAQGNFIFAGITCDGPLFRFGVNLPVTGSGTYAMYTFRHINVGSVLHDSTYALSVPAIYGSDQSTWVSYMGNITVGGHLLNSLAALDAQQLFATQLIGAYGETIEMRGSPYLIAGIDVASNAACSQIGSSGGRFVSIATDVQRAECTCAAAYSSPYCTMPADPLVFTDAYSPTPVVCDVEHCDACLFGQSTACGGCSLGYGLTSSLSCDTIACVAPQCSSCRVGSGSACATCASGYVLDASGAGTCVRPTCTAAHCAACVSGSRTLCYKCESGYSLNTSGTRTCVKTPCNVPHCSTCAADQTEVCATCNDGYELQLKNQVCVLYPCGVPHCKHCVAGDANTCQECAAGFEVSSDGTGSCMSAECAVRHCKRCVDGMRLRCDECEAGYWFDRLGGCTVCRAGYTASGQDCLKETSAVAILVGTVFAVQCALLLFAFLLGWCVCRRWRKEDEREMESITAFLEAQQAAHARHVVVPSEVTPPVDPLSPDWKPFVVADNEVGVTASTVRRRRGVRSDHTDPLASPLLDVAAQEGSRPPAQPGQYDIEM